MSTRNRSSSTADEEKDTVGPLCTCGQLSTIERNISPSANNPNNKTKNSWLESSFVHLMAPRNSRSNKTGLNSPQHQLQQSHGFLEEFQHAQHLFDAAQGYDTELCMDCIDAVSAALEKDTQRLYGDVRAYQETVDAAEQRAKTLRNMTNLVNISSTEEAYQQEIYMLKSEVETRQEELAHLKTLYMEQMGISKQLDATDHALHLQQNCLDVESKSFDNRRDLLTTSLSEILLEVDKLSLVSIPKALFDLQVDPRGLRYPLINQLRLAFQPKGDVSSEEVRVAWSQATQLLLFLGKLFDYPGTEWKLVPLADGAKLIYRKEIFNLSPGDCRSLMAWNALLDQIVRHAFNKFKTTGPNRDFTTPKHTNLHGKVTSVSSEPMNSPPFSSFPTSIGDTELARLDPTDHFGWSQVIHRMASNLLWLSDRGSELAAKQVTSMAHCTI
ncbi:autophagy protein Apg6 [Nitzschia inconspicua]|uniref:Autophagy protein Apg6 n=1 Tax=Nitzschia inconspicua TaxID=303405 RepID=A0A9K3Q3P4_9STRA|nr:autophagy protein Apg6 [Nitzschia inconspicua]